MNVTMGKRTFDNQILNVAKFTTLTSLLLLIFCKFPFPILGSKMSSIPNFALKYKYPNNIFIGYLGNLLNTRYNSSPKNPRAGTSVSRWQSSRWFLSRGFCYPEDGGDMFLRNVGSHKIYTESHPRRRYSSLKTVFPTRFAERYKRSPQDGEIRDLDSYQKN
jgi:hypothetical protein